MQRAAASAMSPPQSTTTVLWQPESFVDLEELGPDSEVKKVVMKIVTKIVTRLPILENWEK